VHQLSKSDVPIHVKAQHIIGITKEVTSESLHEAIETLKLVVNKSNTSTKIQDKGDHPVESTEQFIAEHTPGDHSYAEAVKH
jgi:tRNA C32,U32 (ribose-2'-O)-methylase TrmJ